MQGYSKHEYDVDIVSALNRLEQEVASLSISSRGSITTAEYFDRLWFSVDYYSKSKRKSIDRINNIPPVLIIDSNENFYHFALGIELTSRPIYEIKAFLDYQAKRYKGNYYASSDNFKGLVEFLVKDVIKNNSILPFDSLLSEVMSWVRDFGKVSKVISVVEVHVEQNNYNHNIENLIVYSTKEESENT